RPVELGGAAIAHQAVAANDSDRDPGLDVGVGVALEPDLDGRRLTGFDAPQRSALAVDGSNGGHAHHRARLRRRETGALRDHPAARPIRVGIADVGGGAVRDDAPVIEPESAIAELLHLVEVVRAEEERSAVREEAEDLVRALRLESLVAD